MASMRGTRGLGPSLTPPPKAVAPRHLRLRAICGSAPHKGFVPTTASRQLKGSAPYRLRAHQRLRAGSKALCLPRLRAKMGPAPIPAPRRCQLHVHMVRYPGMHQDGIRLPQSTPFASCSAKQGAPKVKACPGPDPRSHGQADDRQLYSIVTCDVILCIQFFAPIRRVVN